MSERIGTVSLVLKDILPRQEFKEASLDLTDEYWIIVKQKREGDQDRTTYIPLAQVVSITWE